MTGPDEQSPAPPPPEPIELFVVEDQPQLLKGIVKLLSAHPDKVRVVGTAMSGEAAVRDVPALAPQVLLLDLELPGIGGIEVCSQVKKQNPDLDVLIFTTFEDEQKVYEAMQAGASGYLVKRASPDKVLAGILEVHAGGTVIEATIAKRFWNYFNSVRARPDPKRPDPWGLTELERQVLQFVAKGLSNAEVGKVMSIERRTVKTHLSHIYRKLGVSSHVEAVVMALKAGLVEL
jgi:DNA-binding NarL/FixJ family response regulator